MSVARRSDVPGYVRLFGTNVKMHQTADESVAYIAELAAGIGCLHEVQPFVILPYTSLGAVIEPARAAGIWVGAQNVHWAQSGEFTGEISAGMLRSLGVDLVLVGHAERRHVFDESDATVNRKVAAARAHGLRVLLCVGETAEDRRAGAGAETIVRQLKLACSGLDDLTDLIVAYEPVWAIGAGGTVAEPAAVREAVAAIRSYAPAVPLVYGGSVDAHTAPSYAALDGVDGLFVGRAARTATGFLAVASTAYADALRVE